MNFDKLGGSNNFLIWIILIVISLGFGKCSNTLGINLFKVDKCEDDKHSRKHQKDSVCYTKPISAAKFNTGGFNNFFGGNGLFILLVIALLFLCKDKDNGSNNTTINIDEEIE